MHHRGIQVGIETGVSHQESQRTFITIQFGRHLLHILQCGIYISHGGGNVQVVQILRQLVGIGKHTISIL